MVLEGDWTGVQGFFGTSEILRRIEFSPPPPQRLGGQQQQQLVKRLEGWWVQVRRIADGWMGGSGSQWQLPTTRKARKLTAAAAQRASISLLCQQPLSVPLFFGQMLICILRGIFHRQIPQHSRGIQIPLLLYWLFHRLILSCRDLSHRPVCHAQVQSRWRANQYQPGQ